ncbi:MAG: hypothetical protein CVV18_00140 [Gammaproteobacteria bacterium HGW-Gammaproteobacteria-8]|nr:MAG: hypothetical protein CVV18_00140 [Gammaproteobacteria bacterium HGW-Gammaproteobacteria-8]
MTTVFAPDKNSATVATKLFRLVMDYLVSQGINPDPLLAESGLSPELLSDSDARLSFSTYSAFCKRSRKVTGDPDFGLHVGTSVKPGYLGALGFALMSCQTVRQALERSRRYSGIILNACSNELELGPVECARFWRSRLANREPLGRLHDEMNLAVWITLARWISGRADLRPIRVAFRHCAPENTREYERVFACDLIFSAPETALFFPAQWLELKLPQGDRTVLRSMDQVCTRLLDRLAREQQPVWLSRVRQAIVDAFTNHGTPQLAQIAHELSITQEQLSMLLEQSGTSFRELVDQLRKNLATDYLSDLDLSLLEISFLLGFSEQSAFQRAFKRWTGKTPGEFRHGARAS